MSTAEERVEEAVARYLEFLELGGEEPDLSDLSVEESARVREIIGMLNLTEGIALRSGHPEEAHQAGRGIQQLLETAAGPQKALLEELAAALPAGAPVDLDSAPGGFALPGLPVAGAWTVGTTGGRVRVWLIDMPAASELEKDLGHLSSLDRVFRAFPETAAICLACLDGSSLLLEPEDCAPVIEVPAGGLSARRYRRPIQPVGESLAAFIRELVPAWEALPRFEAASVQAMDVAALAARAAGASIDIQRALGSRARYPKKDVLTSLGEEEARALTDMAIALYEGRSSASDVAALLERLAEPR